MLICFFCRNRYKDLKHDPHAIRQRPFTILIILLLTIFFLDRSVQIGLFLDGLIYASIARDMAQGVSSFWAPTYANNSFWSHPPLMFGLESLFFSIFGPFYHTEKVYSFFIWILTVVLIPVCWRSISNDKRFQSFYWLPLLMWGFMPSILWSYPNNILDSTMAVFDLCAVIFLLRNLQKGITPGGIITASFFVFLATFTKGPSGLFPVALPLLYHIVYRQSTFGKAVLQCIAICSFVIAYYCILYQFPQSKLYISNYLDIQLVQSLSGNADATESVLGRLVVLEMLLTEMLLVVGVMALAYILSKIFKARKESISGSGAHILLFLLIGLSASLPLMVSLKIRSFYLVPSLPYFAIAGAIWAYAYLIPLTERFTMPRKAVMILNGLFVVTVAVAGFLLYGKFNTIGRDHYTLDEVKAIVKYVPPGGKTGIHSSLEGEYSLLAYLQRYPDINAYEIVAEPGKTKSILMQEGSASKIYMWLLYIHNYRRVEVSGTRFVQYVKD